MRELLSDQALACPDWHSFYLAGTLLGAIFGAGAMAIFIIWKTK